MPKTPSQMFWPSFRHMGTVAEAGDGRLVIAVVSNGDEVYAVSDDARITRDQNEITLSELVEGDAVTVTATRKMSTLIATEIAAKTGS